MRPNFTDSILDELENFEDGSFQIRNLNGYAMLSVFKAGKNGKAVSVKEVLSRIKLFGIEVYDTNLIQKVVREADGEEYKIAEWKGGQPQDANVELEFSPDSMQCYMTITPPKHGGHMISKTDLQIIFKNNGIKYGLKEDVIENILTNNKYYIKYLIAEGTQPISSTNGYIKVHFDSSSKPELNPDERGKVDFRDIHLIKSVKAGEILAEKVDPHPGKPGKTIFGVEIPFDIGEQGEWKLGENVCLDNEGKNLRSLIEGRPVLDSDGTIRVDEVCLLENVDYSTGNVDFPGTIIVEGNVADNFTLRTKGSLIIKKSVGRVFLHADKDIVLSGGVMGRNGGHIEAGNDIYAKFIEQGNLKAGHNILIVEASMHSELVAGDSIIIMGGRGELIGGETIAGNSITVSKLGAVVETRTNLMIGLPPAVLDELKKMKMEIIAKEETLNKILQSLQKTNESFSQKKELSVDEKELLKKLIGLEKKYSDIIRNLNAQYESITSNYDGSENSFIEVEKFIYPRVSINFGKGKLFNSELKTINGKCYVYLSQDGVPQEFPFPPKNIKKSLQNPKNSESD